MPAAARISDSHRCPAHGGGDVSSGAATVNIGYQPAARVGDTAVCSGSRDAIRSGAPNVFIEHRAAARFGDPTEHGGHVTSGCPTVNICGGAQADAMVRAAENERPFVEPCEIARGKKELEMAQVVAHDTLPDATTSASQPLEPAGAVLAPTQRERAVAAQVGDSSDQRVARENVVRDFYARHGMTQQEADQDIGLDGRPPRAGGAPGALIDVGQPLEAVPIASGSTLAQEVQTGRRPTRSFVAASEAPDAAGLRIFEVPGGEALRVALPVDPGEKAGAVKAARLVVSPKLQKAARCVDCMGNRCRCGG